VRRLTYRAMSYLGTGMGAPAGETTIAVLGLGYVGCVTAACFANLGYRVIGVDKDQHKVSAIIDGTAPFYEPDLEDLIRNNVNAGRLSATVDLGPAIHEADVAMICVGTPSERNGNLALGQLRRVCADISELLPGRTKSLIVAVRSTVFPGTCEETAAGAFGGTKLVSVVSNPEFLREGSAVKDFIEPSLIVVGGSDTVAVQKVADLYAPLGLQASVVSLRTAEMIKYACNAFHAVKIAFANEIGTLASHLGVSGDEVMQTLCQDTRLNISTAYLKPGLPFGGSCLPKDLRALVFRASRLDISLPMLASVLPSNESHLERGIAEVLELPSNARIGVFGLAFKENTDDLRESPVVVLIERLIGKGRDLRIFDPHIQLDQIYGSNRNFVLNAIPHIGRLLERSIDDVTGWASHLVIAQKPSAEMMSKLQSYGLPIINLTRIEVGQRQHAAV
jgi:GDP-mannose 6-dehydrogenase